jgi:hypothetical protein
MAQEEKTVPMPVFPEVQMNLVTPKAPVTGTVVKSEVCLKGGRKSASFVRHVEIDISGTPLEGQCRAGQSFGVIAPGVKTCSITQMVQQRAKCIL